MNPIIFRLTVIAAVLVIWFWTQKLIARNCGGIACIGDAAHRLTANLHRYSYENETSADRALVIKRKPKRWSPTRELITPLFSVAMW